MTISLIPQPLTADAFAAFGDVIEARKTDAAADMNSARFTRFDALATSNHETSANTIISIAQCRQPSSLPYEVTLMERHPYSSQAFIPLDSFEFIVVVAPAGDRVDESRICAFITNGQQGINYHRGVWHMPLIAFAEGQRFLVVDADETRPNCDEHNLSTPQRLEKPL